MKMVGFMKDNLIHVLKKNALVCSKIRINNIYMKVNLKII